MQLLQLYYNAKNKQPKYLLLLYLGQKNNKLIGIQSDMIAGDEFQSVKSNSIKLKDMSMSQAIYWFKQYCPVAYKNGYREIHISNITSVDKYDL